MGQAHIVIHQSIRQAVEEVAKILSEAELDVGTLHRIETPLLPAGYHGVMSVVIQNGEVSFKRDEDT